MFFTSYFKILIHLEYLIFITISFKFIYTSIFIKREIFCEFISSIIINICWYTFRYSEKRNILCITQIYARASRATTALYCALSCRVKLKSSEHTVYTVYTRIRFIFLNNNNRVLYKLMATSNGKYTHDQQYFIPITKSYKIKRWLHDNMPM